MAASSSTESTPICCRWAPRPRRPRRGAVAARQQERHRRQHQGEQQQRQVLGERVQRVRRTSAGRCAGRRPRRPPSTRPCPAATAAIPAAGRATSSAARPTSPTSRRRRSGSPGAPEGALTAPGAVATVPVDEAGVRGVDHLEAGLPHAVAPVHVLEVEEEALVHGPAAVEGLAPRQQAAAEDPVHRARPRWSKSRIRWRLHRAAVGKQLAQEGAPQQQRAQGVEATAGLLQGAVLLIAPDTRLQIYCSLTLPRSQPIGLSTASTPTRCCTIYPGQPSASRLRAKESG